MSPLPLTIEAMTYYAKIFGFDEDLKFFLNVMSEIDDEYLLIKSEEAQRHRDQEKSTAPAPRSRSKK